MVAPAAFPTRMTHVFEISWASAGHGGLRETKRVFPSVENWRWRGFARLRKRLPQAFDFQLDYGRGTVLARFHMVLVMNPGPAPTRTS